MIQNSSTAQKKLINGYFRLYPDESARLLSDFKEDDIINYLKSQKLELAVRVFENVNPDIAAGATEKMSDELFTQLFSALDPNFAARLLSRIDE
ncbi:MAG: hypothetical protein WBQ32_03545 [Ignavibacteriaceae bacterium]